MSGLAGSFAGGDWANWTGLPREPAPAPFTPGPACSVPRCLGCLEPGSWLCPACVRSTVELCTAIGVARAVPRIESPRPEALPMPSGDVQLTLGDGIHAELRKRYAGQLRSAELRDKKRKARWRR